MFYQKLKETLRSSIASVTSNLSDYVTIPGKDMTRTKKISPELLISFLISQGASSTKCECLDFFQFSPDLPSASALTQRRSQLKPEALEAVFHTFMSASRNLIPPAQNSEYRCLAADGSTISFFSFPKYADDVYFASQGNTCRGWYGMHINALYDLDAKTYADAIIQPFHEHDEFAAFCQLVDRCEVLPNTPNIYIGDRGYCSYNNMAHVIEKEQYFLFRTKDFERKGLIGNFDFPDSNEFDFSVHVTLTRSNRKSVKCKGGSYRRFIGKNVTFDFLSPGSLDTYELSFRIVRFAISENTYECIVTNLPKEKFPVSALKEIYGSRWGIETSFRKLKYTIGLMSYHAYKPEHIKQEIWAKIIAYNAAELLIANTIIETGKRKYSYAINFSIAAHICRIYLRLTSEIDSIDVEALIKKELIPIRKDRQYLRPKTAHFRKPKYAIYRAA